MHGATRDGALADTTDADERERRTLVQPVERARPALGVPGRAQHPQDLAQLTPAADHLVLGELRDLPDELLVPGATLQRLLGEPEVDERRFDARDEQRRGRVLRQCADLVVAALEGLATFELERFAAHKGLAAFELECASGVGESATRELAFARRQSVEERARERRAVLVADRCLHREHGRDAALQERVREAGLVCIDSPVTAVQEDQRRGVLRQAQDLEHALRSRRDDVALLVVELEGAGCAVAGHVQDVILVALQRVADRGEVARFEDTDLDVLVVALLLNRLEDLVQLAFVVEHVAGGLALVGRADRHEDLQRTRQRCRQRPDQLVRSADHRDGGVSD
ncbi:MAG TPA: hypothetical protein VGD80_40100 [Kofleriaceae bacterium]